ncbi:MAG: DUF4838 domain-containing protein, partial [Phycisphaerae bacterium]
VTMSILQKQKLRDPAMGYARDFVGAFESVLPAVAHRGVKVIANAGGVNPMACARAIRAVADRHGVGDKVVIACGGDPRLNQFGMICAVSTFLADVLGVRHYLPEPENATDPLWTIVPTAQTIAVGDLDYAHTPAYHSRDFSLGPWASERTAWMARNRIAWGGRYHIPHAIGNFLRPSKYAAEHPEFYPLLNGARFIPPAWAE